MYTISMDKSQEIVQEIVLDVYNVFAGDDGYAVVEVKVAMMCKNGKLNA